MKALGKFIEKDRKIFKNRMLLLNVATIVAYFSLTAIIGIVIVYTTIGKNWDEYTIIVTLGLIAFYWPVILLTSSAKDTTRKRYSETSEKYRIIQVKSELTEDQVDIFFQVVELLDDEIDFNSLPGVAGCRFVVPFNVAVVMFNLGLLHKFEKLY